MMLVMSQRKINILEEKIQQTQEKLLALGPIRPGSISKQYNVCGNPNCRCKDPDNPKKHGPYYNLSYTWKGRGKTEFVSKDRLQIVKSQIRDYKKMKRLTEEWIEFSIELASLQKEAAKKG